MNKIFQTSTKHFFIKHIKYFNELGEFATVKRIEQSLVPQSDALSSIARAFLDFFESNLGISKNITF